MFTAILGIKTNPFLEQPPDDQILRDDQVAQGLARLDHFIEHGRLATLTGRTGVGKTCLLRAFLAGTDPRLHLPILIRTPRLGATALLRLLAAQLGEQPARGRERLFSQIIAKADGARPVLIAIDDAHLLDPAALTDLRLLADASRNDGRPLFRVLLSGLGILTTLIQSEAFTDIRERISMRVHLRHLDAEGSARYIRKRLLAVGAKGDLFPAGAIALIHDHSGGIPRRINNAATAALIAAATAGKKIVDEDCVQIALVEAV
jgi:general secretion pathway protein A